MKRATSHTFTYPKALKAICIGLLKLNYNPMKQISFFIVALLCLAIYSCSDDGELVEEPTYSKENTTISLEGVFDPSLSVIRDQDTILQAVFGDATKTWSDSKYYDITTASIEVNYQLVNTETGEVYLDTITTISRSTELDLSFFSLGDGIAPLLASDDENIDPAPENYVNLRFLNLATGSLENKIIDLVYYPYHEDPDTYSYVMDTTTVLATVEDIAYGEFSDYYIIPLKTVMEAESDIGQIGVKAYDSSTGELLTVSGVSTDGYYDEVCAIYYPYYGGYNDVTILITYHGATEMYGVPMYKFKVVEALSHKE